MLELQSRQGIDMKSVLLAKAEDLQSVSLVREQDKLGIQEEPL